MKRWKKEKKKRRETKDKRKKETERKERASNLGGTPHIIAKVSPPPKEKASHPNSRHQIRGKIEGFFFFFRYSIRGIIIRKSVSSGFESAIHSALVATSHRGSSVWASSPRSGSILCTFILI